MLAVVVADVEGESEYQFERCQFGTTPDHLRLLSEWFVEQEVEEVVMESTAQSVAPLSRSMADSRHGEKCLDSQILGIEYCEVHRPTSPIRRFREGRSRTASVFTRLAPLAISLGIVSRSRTGGWIDPWPVGNRAISPFSR
jgi:hypothetical protein